MLLWFVKALVHVKSSNFHQASQWHCLLATLLLLLSNVFNKDFVNFVTQEEHYILGATTLVTFKSSNFHEKGRWKGCFHASGVTMAPLIGHFANTVISTFQKRDLLLLFSIGYFTTDAIWAYLKRSPVLLQTKWKVGTKPGFLYTFNQKTTLSPDH